MTRGTKYQMPDTREWPASDLDCSGSFDSYISYASYLTFFYVLVTLRRSSPLTTKLFFFNFHSFEVVYCRPD